MGLTAKAPTERHTAKINLTIHYAECVREAARAATHVGPARPGHVPKPPTIICSLQIYLDRIKNKHQN
jgi:hypothetical protein